MAHKRAITPEESSDHNLLVTHTSTVKPVLRGHSKIYKIKKLKTNGSLMKVELQRVKLLLTSIK